jgi:DNA-binding response OmpR family regulator
MTKKKHAQKILVVEDETPLLHALEKKLTHEGFTVFTAKDGNEGLALALSNHPDLLLVDIVMPHMDGLTMIRQLRKDSWGKDAAILLLTNLSDLEKIAVAQEYKVYDYLVKSDWRLDDIAKKVKTRLGIKE